MSVFAKSKITFYQVVLFVLVAIGFYTLITNMQVNMETKGFLLGLIFFGIKPVLILVLLFDYHSGDTYFKTFLVGLPTHC